LKATNFLFFFFQMKCDNYYESNWVIIKVRQKKRTFEFLVPGMLCVLYNFLSILPPLVTIIQHIHISTQCLEAKPRLSHFLSSLHFLHFHGSRNPQMIIMMIYSTSFATITHAITNYFSSQYCPIYMKQIYSIHHSIDIYISSAR